MFSIPNITVERCIVDNTNYEIVTPDTQDYLEYTETGVILKVDVRDFSPHEITCKVSKQLLEVIAENNRMGRCGLFRKYVLPQNVNPQQCICQINEQGVLCVGIPWEKHVPIAF